MGRRSRGSTVDDGSFLGPGAAGSCLESDSVTQSQGSPRSQTAFTPWEGARPGGCALECGGHRRFGFFLFRKDGDRPWRARRRTEEEKRQKEEKAKAAGTAAPQ